MNHSALEGISSVSPVLPVALAPPTVDDSRVWDVWLSAWHRPALTVADEVGLFALLERSPLAAGEVAAALALSERGALALLGLLAALGFLAQHGGRFTLTPFARGTICCRVARFIGVACCTATGIRRCTGSCARR